MNSISRYLCAAIYWTSSRVQELSERDAWKNLGSICMVESERQVGDSTTIEHRYYISSLDCGAEQFAAVIRHLALNLLKNEKTMKVGVKAKRKRAGWDNEYLRKTLLGSEK